MVNNFYYVQSPEHRNKQWRNVMGTGSLSLSTHLLYEFCLHHQFTRLYYTCGCFSWCVCTEFVCSYSFPVWLKALCLCPIYFFLQLQRWHSCRLVWHSDFLWLWFSQVRQKEKECPIGTPHRYETERVQSKPWILVPPVSATCHRLIRVSFPPQCKEPRASAGRGRGILRGRSPNGSSVRKTDNFLIRVIAAFGRRADNG